MKRFLPHSALWLAVVLGVAACQGEGSDPGPEKDTSPDRTPQSDMDTVDLPDSDLGKLADLAEKRMNEAMSVRVTVNVKPDVPEAEPLESTEMDLLLTDPVAAEMTVEDTVDGEATTSNVVVKDKVMYTQIEGEDIADGKSWMLISQQDIAENEEQLGPMAELFNVLLKETNEALAQASGNSSLDVVRMGELDGSPETEDGEGSTVTRYTGTSSTQDLSDAGHEEFTDLVDQGLEEVSWELAVSEKGLPQEFSVELRSPEVDGPVTSTVDFSGWGSELMVEAPAEEETATLSDSLQE